MSLLLGHFQLFNITNRTMMNVLVCKSEAPPDRLLSVPSSGSAERSLAVLPFGTRPQALPSSTSALGHSLGILDNDLTGQRRGRLDLGWLPNSRLDQVPLPLLTSVFPAMKRSLGLDFS